MPESNAATATLRDWLLTGAAPACLSELQARAIADAAGVHGLTALLDTSPAAAAWPDDVRQLLRQRHQAVLAETVQKLALAQRATAILARAGLRALPLKGAGVAEWLYDSSAERPMDDVDLLLLDDWTHAVRALAAEGFRELERADHAWSFADPVTGFVLELHHGVTSCPALFPLDTAGLWSRSHLVQGQVQRRPSAEDVLAHLSMHAAFQHGLVLRLGQYLDFRRLLERAALSPGTALELARAARAEGAVAVVLEAAAAVVDAPVPGELRAVFAPSLTPALAALVRARGALALLQPARPQLSRVRWVLAAGARGRLVAATLGLTAHRRAPLLQRLRHVAGRAPSLLQRWGAPVLRDVLATARTRGSRR